MRHLRLLALFLTACGGSTPKFSEVQTKVFNVSCTATTCHTIAGGGAGGLELESSVAYDQLVNKMSVGAPDRVRVIPGDTKNSYLIEKLTNPMPMVGAQMPNGGEPLEADRLKLVEDWVAGGAKND